MQWIDGPTSVMTETRTIDPLPARRERTRRAEQLEAFLEFRRTESRAVRDRLIEDFMPLAYSIASSYGTRGSGLDDVRQAALVGLVKAIDGFDPDRGFSFTTYATVTIRGEVRRHFRNHGWAVRPPRTLQEHALEVRAVTRDLVQELGRSPTVAEIATRSRLSTEEVVTALSAEATYTMDHLDLDTDGPAALRGVETRFDEIDTRDAVERALGRLPERDRRLLVMRYYQSRSQSDIARELGISQMHVSRLLRRALERMRATGIGEHRTGARAGR